MHRPIVLNIDGITVNVQKTKIIQVFLEVTKNIKDNPSISSQKRISHRIDSSTGSGDKMFDSINENSSLALVRACLYLRVDNEEITIHNIGNDMDKLYLLFKEAKNLVSYISEKIGSGQYSLNMPE